MDDIIARVEVPVNNSGTCCYYVECRTEEEIDEAYRKARDEGRSARVVRLPQKCICISSTNPEEIGEISWRIPTKPQPILFSVDDEDIII